MNSLFQQNFPNTAWEHPGSRWTKEKKGVQLIIPLTFIKVLYWLSTINFILMMVHKHGINLSKDPPDQYQCLKHRKKELPSMVAGPVPRKFDKHNAANNGRIRFEML